MTGRAVRVGRHVASLGRWTEPLDRLALYVCVALGIGSGIGYATGSIVGGIDAHMVWDASTSYPTHWIANAYVYPPPLAQIVELIHPIGYGLFVASLMVTLFCALWYCARKWSLLFVVGWLIAWRFIVVAPGAVVDAVLLGNVQVLVAAALVAGYRWPALYSFGILTKLAPVLGLVWFAVRREWRQLAIAVTVTLIVGLASFLVDPGAWWRWLAFAETNASVSPLPLVPVPFAIRLLMSLGLIIWGARTDRYWTVPIGVGWSLPALYDWWFLSIWIGAIAARQVTRRNVAHQRPIAIHAQAPAG
ncbi:MAG: DUF2029 domain-containing protein [Chloroflexi bacterium]|nr:DUF2029 domain-containing protein [Chloroflexota bacterium]